jgi:hypothetical protein
MGHPLRGPAEYWAPPENKKKKNKKKK